MKFNGIFLLSFLILSAINLLISYRNGPITGDLTRTGSFSESMYRAQAGHQPIIPAENSSVLAQADIVVVGDSFSKKLAWQGELERLTGLKTISYLFDDIGCVANWMKFVQKSKLAPNVIMIFETVERGFMEKFEKNSECAQAVPAPISGRQVTERLSVSPALIFDASFNLRSVINELRDHSNKPFQSGETISMPLTRPGLFSNARPERILYYVGDEYKGQWSKSRMAAAILNLNTVRSEFVRSGVNFFVVVIPDKSTVYGDLFLSHRYESIDIGESVYRNRLSPFWLTPILKSGKFEVTDLYLPNDSHLGDGGYRLVASELARVLENRHKGATVAQ